jgi:hypothetical protein
MQKKWLIGQSGDVPKQAPELDDSDETLTSKTDLGSSRCGRQDLRMYQGVKAVLERGIVAVEAANSGHAAASVIQVRPDSML